MKISRIKLSSKILYFRVTQIPHYLPSTLGLLIIFTTPRAIKSRPGLLWSYLYFTAPSRVYIYWAAWNIAETGGRRNKRAADSHWYCEQMSHTWKGDGAWEVLWRTHQPAIVGRAAGKIHKRPFGQATCASRLARALVYHQKCQPERDKSCRGTNTHTRAHPRCKCTLT